MNDKHLIAFGDMPRPGLDEMAFMKDLQSPVTHKFCKGTASRKNIAANSLGKGISLGEEVCAELFGKSYPATAFASLKRVLEQKKITLSPDGYKLLFRKDDSFAREEYALHITAKQTLLTAGDVEGLRRGIYFLEDRIREAEGKSVIKGSWKRRPFVKNRISRCFFGPTYRPPYWIDELTNDIDYYPEEYLDRLAHEGINGLWLTMYFHDLPSSLFPGRGKDCPKRFAKLRSTVERCAKYGIRLFIFFSEPKLWGNAYFAVPREEAAAYPELRAGKAADYDCFCTESSVAGAYIEESIRTLFSEVPGLGGTICIMLGEDNGSCVAYRVWNRSYEAVCRNKECAARCRKKSIAQSYKEYVDHFIKPMKEVAPDADFIGWMYTPGQRDGSEFSRKLEDAVSLWSKDAHVMFNFESGSKVHQLGEDRTVFDYSLACVGPSQLFRKVAEKAENPAAKLQVGCSHENASVPFIPVPLHLYRKYRTMKALDVKSVMQCWYFGNYPGLMNKAAGELSFLPFPEKEKDFLQYLAGPDWGRFASTVAKAWTYFTKGYELFPGNIAFAWYGPLHHSIIWPLYLFPADRSMTPSWLLERYPKFCGDRIGECLVYQHTVKEALTLCRKMFSYWQKGASLLEELRPYFKGNKARLDDINLAKCIALQIRSTCNILEFYDLREDMIYNKRHHLKKMRSLVEDEIAASKEMIVLCKNDSRLGYHSEAEGYLFYPAKLRARIRLLEELLKEEFPVFDMNDPSLDLYTGKTLSGKCALLPFGKWSKEYVMDETHSWVGQYDKEFLTVKVSNVKGKSFLVEVEPTRLWPPATVRIEENGKGELDSYMLSKAIDARIQWEGNDVTISFPMEIFAKYRRKGYPMRINIRSGEFAWVPYIPVQSRTLHENYNPACAGFLTLEGEETLL